MATTRSQPLPHEQMPDSVPGKAQVVEASRQMDVALAQKRSASVSYHMTTANGHPEWVLKELWVGKVGKKARPRCGAKTRAGTPCQARACLNQDGSSAKRCRLHGGLSTGPRTMQGRAKISMANSSRKGTKYRAKMGGGLNQGVLRWVGVVL